MYGPARKDLASRSMGLAVICPVRIDHLGLKKYRCNDDIFDPWERILQCHLAGFVWFYKQDNSNK